MYYSRKKPMSEPVHEMTPIWACTKEGCNGWMRENYTLQETPTCSQCQSPMARTTREIPVLTGSGFGLKTETKK
ncbi:cold-shock protein [Paenibacillus soyae]|uniref:Cold-shock protein n=1 Tax=Paenibacillus soyae TaxID=2969249 RepID=A0A9X2S8J6_9BACL|nr:cold-shock protein [Paenibacillus soyae]MCR2804126.1 cold-shock protein [Paenibacillus soyae]